MLREINFSTSKGVRGQFPGEMDDLSVPRFLEILCIKIIKLLIFLGVIQNKRSDVLLDTRQYTTWIEIQT